jgi:hypothetical protein
MDKGHAEFKVSIILTKGVTPNAAPLS